MAQQPQTVDEWKEAATLALGLRLLHDAKLYGFVEGGPEVDIERVDEIIDQARSVGIVPTMDEAQQAALDFIAQSAEASEEQPS